MIDINLKLNVSDETLNIDDNELINAIRKSTDTGEVVKLKTSKQSQYKNFSDNESRYEYLQHYFNSSSFEV